MLDKTETEYGNFSGGKRISVKGSQYFLASFIKDNEKNIFFQLEVMINIKT